MSPSWTMSATVILVVALTACSSGGSDDSTPAGPRRQRRRPTGRASRVQQAVAGSTSAQAVRTVQLSTDIDDNLGTAVVATAPAEMFDDSQVATILRTFRPTKATT